MNSVNQQDLWLSEATTVDDFGIVELLLKSLDSSEVVSGHSDHCWTSGSDKSDKAKLGYEPYTLPCKQTLKRDSCDSYPLSNAQILDVDLQRSQASSLPTPQYPSFHHSAPHSGFGQAVTHTTASESWLPNNYKSNFESFKVVPELLVERIYHDDVYQNFSHTQSKPPVHHLKFEVSSPYLCSQVRYKLEGKAAPVQCEPQQLIPGAPLAASHPSLASVAEHSLQQASFDDIVVKQEPLDDAMNLSGHFMCHPMFMMNSPPTSSKCGCDLSKTQASAHFLCGSSNKSAMSMEEYGELLKRNSAALLVETQSKSYSAPHQSIRSDKERPFTCDECGKSFLLKHHLVTHSRVHTGVRPFGCSDCGKTFAHKHCLVTHQRLHSGQRPFQCLECKKSFTLKHHLVTHERTHSKDRPYHCEECGKTFAQKRNLITHNKLHSGERPFQCAICGECFSQREHLLAHSRFHGGESAFVCMDCGEAFARKFQLVDHRRVHGHSPFACTICGKEFLQKRTLLAHTKIHEHTAPYFCKICNQSFPSMSDMIAHSKIHNSFACKECGCTFPTNEDFAMHLQHHGHFEVARPQVNQYPPPRNPKPFSCSECGSGFAQKHGLTQHMRKKHSSNNVNQASNAKTSTLTLNSEQMATVPLNPEKMSNVTLNPEKMSDLALSSEKMSNLTLNPEKMATLTLNASNCDIMEQIKNQVLSEQLKAKIQ